MPESSILHVSFVLKEVPNAYMAPGQRNSQRLRLETQPEKLHPVNSDIFEVGTFEMGPRPKDPEALDFIVAHEVGRVAASQVTYSYTFVSSFIFILPLLGTALS
jgi:hypothetical protein